MQGCCCGKLKSGYIHHLGADAPARGDHRRPGDFPQSRGKGRQPGLCPGAAGLPRCHGGRSGTGTPPGTPCWKASRRRGWTAPAWPAGRCPPARRSSPWTAGPGGKRHHLLAGANSTVSPGGCWKKLRHPAGAGGLLGAPAGNPPGDRGRRGQAGALLGEGGHLGPGPRPWPPARGAAGPVRLHQA